MLREIVGSFSKVADTGKSIVIGTLGKLDRESISHNMILEIAAFYNLNVIPEQFTYHFITPGCAEALGCKLPIGNYNCFLEIYK